MLLIVLFATACGRGSKEAEGAESMPATEPDSPSTLQATAAPLTLNGTINAEGSGRILCGGRPLSDVPVEIWDSDGRGSDIADDLIASGFTGEDGRFNLRGTGGDPLSGPDVYVRVLYGAQVEDFTSGGSRFVSRVDIEDEIARTRYNNTDRHAHDNLVGVADFGDIELQTLSRDCDIFWHARDVVRDWHLLMSRPFPAAGNEARILRWSYGFATPHTPYDIVKLPTNYGARTDLRSQLFHELGHTIGFNIHSNHLHWLADLSTFVYARRHHPAYHARDAGSACITQECAEGFAWSEGFAEFWQERAVLPLRVEPRMYTPHVRPGDPGQEWEYEGNVRNRLLFLAGCLGGAGTGYRDVVLAAMRPLPLYSIHSLPDFEAYALSDYPNLQTCIDNNASNVCGRLCRSNADCGGACSTCQPVTYGDTVVSECH